MSKVSVLNEKLEKASEIEIPASYGEINPHNLYLYVKSYLASLRANTAHTKGRSDVSGGARAGSTRTNVWVGGAVAFGPTNERNYEQKVNKKQKRLALEFAINEKAESGKIFIFDDLEIKSGKSKDAANFIKNLGVRDALIVKNELDAQTLLAYRNLKNCYVIDASEINAYLVAVYGSVVFEKAAFESIVKED